MTISEQAKIGLYEETQDELMTPAEVAILFQVNPKTVSRWSRAGRLTALRTLGGHRRFQRREVLALRDRINTSYAYQ